MIRLLEIKHKGRINKVVEELEVTWPTNLQQEIVECMKTAEKEVLKTIEGIGMIPGLRAANVVFQNQRTGDLTMLNSVTTAFVSETSIFPDEQNIATFKELFDLDNDILLGNLQKDRTPTIEQIAEIIADTQGTEKRGRRR